MIDALMAILTGGATGLLGTALGFAAEYLTARQTHAHEVELRRFDMELARVEAASAERAAVAAAETAESAAAWSALEASYRESGARLGSADSPWLTFVDVVRGLLRPLLTLGSLALVAAMYFTLGSTDIEILDIRPRIVDTALYVATTCVLWWFGARSLDKRARGGRA